MKAKFYNRQNILVLEINKDARFELNNGSKAKRKGAVRGELYNATGEKVDELQYA